MGVHLNHVSGQEVFFATTELAPRTLRIPSSSLH